MLSNPWKIWRTEEILNPFEHSSLCLIVKPLNYNYSKGAHLSCDASIFFSFIVPFLCIDNKKLNTSEKPYRQQKASLKESMTIGQENQTGMFSINRHAKAAWHKQQVTAKLFCWCKRKKHMVHMIKQTGDLDMPNSINSNLNYCYLDSTMTNRK